MEGEKPKAAFRDLEQRISAMSYVHEELYKSHNLADINFDEYLKKISTNLVSIYNKSVRVNQYLFMENQDVNIDIAVPCGLIVNELLTNALKHAFPDNFTGSNGKEGKVVDIFFTEKDNTYELRLNDNGIGLPEEKDLEDISSMGFHLVKIIAEDQLRGSWQMESKDGVRARIEFPKK